MAIDTGPLPWKRNQLFGGIPCINWSHPLTRGLIGCWLPGITGGFDLCGFTQPLTNPSAAPRYITPDGIASRSSVSGTFNGWVTTLNANSPLKNWSQFTWFWRGVIIGNPDPYVPLVAITWDNAGNNPYYMAAITSQGGGADWSDTRAFWATGSATYLSTPGFNLGPTFGSESSIAATYVGTGNVTTYLNGAVQKTTGFAGAPTSTSTSQLLINGFNVTARTPNAASNMVCAWNRALSSAELLQLQSEPYCFLWYPEDEIFTKAFVPPSVVTAPAIIGRWTKPSTSLPRIDWTNSLARGLVFYGYDYNGLILDLVGNRTMLSVGVNDPVISTPYGTVCNYNLDGSKYFTSDAALRASYPAISFACAYMQTGTVGSYCSPFMRSANNNASNPYINFVFNLNPAGAGQNTASMGYSITGPNVVQSPNWTGNANNVFTTLLGTVDSLGNNNFYAQGVLVNSGSLGAYVPYTTQDSVIFSGVSDAAATNPFDGYVYYGAFWNRVLTPSEALQLYLDPYCFLRFQENDLYDTFMPPSVLVWDNQNNVFVPRSKKGPPRVHSHLLNAALPTQVVAPTVTAGTLPFMGVG